jgi:hypothetical protein
MNMYKLMYVCVFVCVSVCVCACVCICVCVCVCIRRRRRGAALWTTPTRRTMRRKRPSPIRSSGCNGLGQASGHIFTCVYMYVNIFFIYVHVHTHTHTHTHIFLYDYSYIHTYMYTVKCASCIRVLDLLKSPLLDDFNVSDYTCVQCVYIYTQASGRPVSGLSTPLKATQSRSFCTCVPVCLCRVRGGKFCTTRTFCTTRRFSTTCTFTYVQLHTHNR